jgi:hypothetical protein
MGQEECNQLGCHEFAKIDQNRCNFVLRVPRADAQPEPAKWGVLLGRSWRRVFFCPLLDPFDLDLVSGAPFLIIKMLKEHRVSEFSVGA